MIEEIKKVLRKATHTEINDDGSKFIDAALSIEQVNELARQIQEALFKGGDEGLLTPEELYKVTFEVDVLESDIVEHIKTKWYRSSECIVGKNIAKAQQALTGQDIADNLPDMSEEEMINAYVEAGVLDRIIAHNYLPEAKAIVQAHNKIIKKWLEE